MSGYLLDVNVLIALMWPAHESHATALNWFQRNNSQGWATCPFTQAAFVRIVSNPAFSRDAVTPQEAVSLLESNLRHTHHEFWPDELDFVAATRSFLPTLIGHRQVTDAYLLGLAQKRKGKLVSLDRSVAALLPKLTSEKELLVLL